MSSESIIRFADARLVYPNGTVGLDRLSVDIEAGEFVIVVGLSGAGKSTMLRAINGLVRLTAGSLVVDGAEMVGMPSAQLRRLRAKVGMIFQDYRLIKRLPVLTNVLIGRLARVPTWRALLGMWPPADVAIAQEALQRVGLPDRSHTRAGSLSGGQMQRVGIARALAQEPRIVLADEPVASLDPITSHQVMRDLVTINRELGITTLVNLHFLDLAKRYGQRLIGLRAGTLVYDGPAADVTESDFREIYGRPPTADDVLEKEVGHALDAVPELT
jgi:phosphonate transport system ATP-binding protein